MNAQSALANRRPTIAIVDDDVRLCDLLQSFLLQNQLHVRVAHNGEELNTLLASEIIDLIVLDVMLPGETGLGICRRLRSAGNHTPIIMLTARREEMDRITGLEVGADDYVGKPFNPRELLARINAVLRRQWPSEAPGGPAPMSESVKFGPFVLDLAARKLTRDGREIALTTGEFATLKAFVRHTGEPLTRERLALLARGREIGPSDRSLDVQISRLRRLIEDNPAMPRYLQTVWGVGYVFVSDADR